MPTFCFGQMIFEQVLDQTVVVHSILNLGNTNLYEIPFKLPPITNSYFLRVTVYQVNKNLQKTPSLLSNILSLYTGVGEAVLAGKLLQPPSTSDNIDVFILRANDLYNFKNNKPCQSIYQSLSTVSMNKYIGPLPEKARKGGYLCLRNKSLKKGVTVHIEMVAEVGWDKNLKQELYNQIKEGMEKENKYSPDKIKSFCDCFVKTFTSKEIKKFTSMLDSERDVWMKQIADGCKTKAGIIIK